MRTDQGPVEIEDLRPVQLAELVEVVELLPLMVQPPLHVQQVRLDVAPRPLELF